VQRRSIARLLTLVALVGGVGAGAYVLRPQPRPALPARPPDDDIELLVGLLDADAPLEPWRDLLVAGDRELYFARASDHAIVAVPKSGAGAARTLAVLDAPIRGMARAGDSLWLTTTHKAEGGARGAVLRVATAGGPPSVVVDDLARPRALATDGRWVFVVDVDPNGGGLLRESVILRLPASAGVKGAAQVLARCSGEVTSLAIDDANVYWADRLEGAIMAAPKAGGAARAIAGERGLPEQVVYDAGSLYWVERRTDSLWTMPATGGPPRRIAQDFAGFVNLVADPRGAWWRSEAAVDGAFRVLTVPKGSDDTMPASDPVDSIDALASDGEHLYWARGDDVARVPAP
jgi:hypothetical protein